MYLPEPVSVPYINFLDIKNVISRNNCILEYNKKINISDDDHVQFKYLGNESIPTG